jgi:voltage-gated potassium channel Kch
MVLIVSIGIGLTAVTVMLHGLGTVMWIQFMRRRQEVNVRAGNANVDPKTGSLKSKSIIWILCYTSVMLAVLHLLEVSVWAMAYILNPRIEGLDGAEEAFYYSMVTFTSLGYGDVVITNSWRILGGIEAMAGMIVFGWSSALLLTAFLKMLNLPVDE